MPRPRSFDEDDILDRAMEVFWLDGYAGASVARLEAATGLGRKSLYNAFGDKAELFRRSLGRFQRFAGERFLHALEAQHASRPAIEDTVRGLAAMAGTSLGRRGCFVCNTLREPVARTSAVRADIDRYFARVHRGFRAALERAREADELARDADVDALSDYLLGTLIALCVMLRSSTSRESVAGFAETALGTLDHPPRSTNG